jgi:hypothetical protein
LCPATAHVVFGRELPGGLGIGCLCFLYRLFGGALSGSGLIIDQQRQGGVGLKEAAAIAGRYKRLSINGEDAPLHGEPVDLRLTGREEGAATCLGGFELLWR